MMVWFWFITVIGKWVPWCVGVVVIWQYLFDALKERIRNGA